MKPALSSASVSTPKQRRKGVALVMVLSSLVLIAMLVLVLLSMARTEQQSSSAFAESANVRNLAEIPLNLAIGQIRKATEQLGHQGTWASQPGMIRTFGMENDGSGIRSRAMALYKLYSDDIMVVSNDGVSPTASGLGKEQVQSAIESDISDLANWQSQKGLFTDLNEPAPVMDEAGSTPEWEFPIVDPRGMAEDGNTPPIDGFSLNSTLDGAVVPNSRTDRTARLPMPVKWIYVLQDGRLATPISQEDDTVRFDTSSGAVSPTADNPITGRIAFWADDESSKVNINTALEGIPWETPRTTSDRDYRYADRMPAQNEFIRYPGHPAQTCLSPIFQAFSSNFVLNDELSDATLKTRLEHLHSISPRYTWGGTYGGTQKATAAILNNKTDRLYSTLDELLYKPDRTLNEDDITGRDLAIGKFFLTTNSRANELSPQNKPKVLLWPLSRETKDRTATDRLMAMLSAGGVEGGNARSVGWYFERYQNAKITTGIVGSGHTTYQDLTTRSDSMLNAYLRYYMGQKVGSETQQVPGFYHPSSSDGQASYASREKYGTSKRSQILIEMLDLLRFGVNTENVVEKNLPGGVTYKYLPPHKDTVENPSRRAESSAAPLVAYNQSAPNKRADKPSSDALVSDYTGFTHSIGGLRNAKGFGRFPTFTEATLVFHKRYNDRMRCFLLFEPFSPTCGPPAWTANYRYRVLFEGQENAITDKAQNVNFDLYRNNPKSTAWTSDSVPSFQLRFFNDQDWIPMKFPRPHNPSGPQSAPASTDSGFNLDNLGVPNLAAEKSNAPYGLIRSTWPVSMVNWPVDLLRDTETDETGNTTPFAGLLSQFKRARQDQSVLSDNAVALGKDPNPPVAWRSTNWTLGKNVEHANYFPFYTRDVIEIPVDPGTGQQATTFQFSGGKITVALFLGWTGDDKHLPVQRIHFSFPPAIFPIPVSPPSTFGSRFNGGDGVTGGRAEAMRNSTIIPGDTTRSVEPDPAAPPKGDLRFYAGYETVPEEWFSPGPNYFSPTINGDHGLRDGTWMEKNQLGNITTRSTAGTLLTGVVYPDHSIPAVTRGINGAYRIDGRPGDWDTGVGGIEDGPYVNKPDEGTGALELGGYFSRGGHHAATDDITFSPNRMIASAVAFGSLPSGIIQNYPFPESGNAAARFRAWPARQPAPWQTLLFCPNPAGRTTPAGQEPNIDDHIGFQVPRDHLLLDAFTMPAIEPYAISDNFSTAGKVNLNHQILPFNYINRSTGLHAVFKGTHVTAIPTSEVANYKNPAGTNREFRYSINSDLTLDGLDMRFEDFDVYRSPSEICTIFLVPKKLPSGNYGSAAEPPLSYTDMNEWWNGSINNMSDAMELTGDNVREAPYNSLYPRLTTQSNTYTVHYRVQTLRKARSTDPTTWVVDRDAVNSEYRGSAIVERYLDPNEQELGSVGLGDSKFVNSWDSFFRFRIIQNKQFAR